MAFQVTYFKKGTKRTYVFATTEEADTYASRQKRATKVCETDDQPDHFLNIPTRDLFTLCPVTRKRRYQSVAQAEHFLRQVILHGNAKQHAYRRYRCPHCNGWHLSSKPIDNYR